jgi:hypothetical protein
VGCRREQIGRWGAMKSPPSQMRKGFDQKLAYALQTTRDMLFTDWRETAPEHAERIWLHPDQFSLSEAELIRIQVPEEQLLLRIVPWLMASEQEWLLLQAALKVIESNDRRAPLFWKILERFKPSDRPSSPSAQETIHQESTPAAAPRPVPAPTAKRPRRKKGQ